MSTTENEATPEDEFEDESVWRSYTWRQRDKIGGRWGVFYEVYPPYAVDPVASGWRPDLEQANRAAAGIISRLSGKEE